jgi:L-ascorbate metabolism protein UlaG (beta-lactamase superfamily)
MPVLRLAAAALVLLAFSQRPPLDARFIGNMAFAISDGTTTLMTDFPYQSGYSVYNEYPPSEIRSATPTTLSLITHRHGDHWEPALFAKTGWQVAGPDDVIANAPAHRVVPLADSTDFGPIRIERLRTPHANIGHHSYVVNWHGKRMYFSGDTEATDSLMASRNLDVAFISPWVFRTVVKAGLKPDARRIVIYHHEASERVPECPARCTLPKQGDTIRIE